MNVKDTEGRTALIKASFMGEYAVVSLLLAHGADINVTDHYGKTAMMYACEFACDSTILALDSSPSVSFEEG